MIFFWKFFSEDYHGMREQQRLTTRTARCHEAKSVMDIGAALNNLEMDATIDQDIAMKPMKVNKELVHSNMILLWHLMDLTAQLKMTLDTIQELSKHNEPTNQKRNTKNKDYDPNGHWWTHGYKVHYRHGSKIGLKKIVAHEWRKPFWQKGGIRAQKNLVARKFLIDRGAGWETNN